MIAARIMELRRRRGLMITLIVMDLGFPALFLVIRLLLNAFAPRTSPPAGGYLIFVILAAGFLPTFGFISAVMLGATTGSRDLAEGMFRHLVVTGRSRLALYLTRIPAGLAILAPLLAVSYVLICAVSVFAAPAFVSDWNLNIPPGLSKAGFENWSRDRALPVICSLYDGRLPAGATCPGPPWWSKSAVTPAQPASPALETVAAETAARHYSGYQSTIRAPGWTLMIETGLWVELGAGVIFVLGLGLASLMGQRTGPVILLLVFQLILTPIIAAITLPQLQFLRRSVIGFALTRLEPSGLPVVAALPGISGGSGGPRSGRMILPGSVADAALIILAWLAVSTALGAWRMMTRDA